LQGRRNRRIDHLLYILTEKAVPYFAAKHRRQELGFEGLDLELTRWKDLEKAAQEIAKSDIEESKDGSYRVRSLTDRERWYNVDVSAPHCECLSFPHLSFCKHIAAIQHHFPVSCSLVPFPSPSQPNPEPLLAIDVNVPSQNKDPDVPDVARIARKLLDFVEFADPGQLASLTPSLLHLEAGLNHATISLPKQVRVAPNQRSWPETAAVMGVKPKKKRKTHADPYAGGQRSGKKAKPDAKTM
jgi:hypothetical protein